MSATNQHVERARQIAEALDSSNVEQTLHEQFVAEWKAWEAEDTTRTMAAFDRAIGRGNDYTGRIVRFVTGSASTRTSAFADGGEDARKARKVLKDPEQRKQVIASMPTAALDALTQEATEAVVQRARAERAEHRTDDTPTTGQISGGDRFNPSEAWADTLIIRANRNLRELSKHVERFGFVLGSMDREEAFTYMQDTERLAAEVRAAVQEQIRDSVEA